MNITLPLKEMSVEEKLQTMEALWGSLSESSDEIKSPLWHGDILTKREEDAQKEDFIDWKTAKKNIKNKTS